MNSRALRLLLAAVILLAGCASQPERRTLTPADFAQSNAGTGQAPTPVAVAETADEPLAADVAPSAAEANSSTSNMSATTAPNGERAPSSLSARPLEPGDEVVIDSVIGQVSGRPIFADEFLAPIADQLKQESQRLPPREFVERANDIVSERLNQLVLNELFLAEAEAGLSVEEKQGLLAWMRDVRERTISQGGGSVGETQREIQEEFELTLEEYQEIIKDRALIKKLLDERIAPRVIVSWKDIEREYQRRYAEFNPPATVTFKRLRLSNSSQAGLIDQVKTKLAAGESFESIAALVGPENITQGEPMEMGPAGVSDVPLSPAITEALKGLETGDTSAAIAGEAFTTWYHVAAVDQPKQYSLFEMQRQLGAELKRQREDEQRQKYIQTLFEKGIFDDLQEMSRRILEVAVMRYGR